MLCRTLIQWTGGSPDYCGARNLGWGGADNSGSTRDFRGRCANNGGGGGRLRHDGLEIDF